MDQTTFAQNDQASKHLIRINVFLDLEPVGVHGFQYHFDDRDPVPEQSPVRGKHLPLLIDGPGGERLRGMHVFWSNKAKCAGLMVPCNTYPCNFFN